MPFKAPLSDFQFLLENIVGLDQLRATELFAETDRDMTEAILSEAGKLCAEVIAPGNRAGDEHHSVLENGRVRAAPGFAEAYRAIAEGGWVCVSAPVEHGGMGLPVALQTAINDMMSSANLSLQLNPLLSQGQIEALAAHASDELKALYLPKLISGEWSGTMNLTESGAGSDVGALATKAERNADGTYAITGQKIYITWGDCDFVGNVCHLVLARLPNGKPGTKGISLFMVPRDLPDENGAPGVANALKVVSIEHKLGIHGSPTCVMEFDGAKGWLVGEEHGGMAAMFTMMNNARLGVAAQGIGIAEAATQKAIEYALERKQGRVGGTGMIIEYPDVRRMLMTMKAETFAARAIALANAVAIDMSHATGDEEWTARAALLTPISKAHGTDTGHEVAQIGVQVHGGMGFIEETGAAQFARDVRVTQIYEGTNGIQAMDLVARKMMDGGAAAYALLDEVEAFAETARGTLPELAKPVFNAAENFREATEWLVEQEMQDRFAGCVAYLRAFARVLGAHYHLMAAMAEGGAGPRTKLARFFIKRILPEHESLIAQLRDGAEGLYAMSVEELEAV
ncbi:acyl-CoA dehydrogenase [Aliiruegeria sabulilitoris]|uniref:acyl-CoA dehydrogenase n=1 Tax=Aliiruegeria sabulilitoris TaxID=1510458 RepID=UPI0008360732|nr:acyl-CoA dehydrogenase [Aliiruegeria sabulilitoris]NDR57782.1 acyl-CoA dehydrogenase [Pseudoruegeria sp. M32A2M]